MKQLTNASDVTAEMMMNTLKELQYEESAFTKILNAKTVQELLDIEVKPEEILSYFQALEKLGTWEEENNSYQSGVSQRIKDASPARSRRHALFI